MIVESFHVKMGEVEIAKEQGILFAIGLGSCVAVALYDPRAKVSGLAHVILPASKNGENIPPGRFAPTAVRMLIDNMVEAGARKRGMFARIAGGAAMFKEALPPAGARLGERNIDAVREVLAECRIPIKGEDVGGTFGRSVYLDASDGSFLIRAVTRKDVTL